MHWLPLLTGFMLKSCFSQPDTQKRMQKVLVLGHRGMGCSIPGTLSRFPENSLSSFKEARRVGADGVELDVFLSKRGDVLVMHGYKIENSLCLTTLHRSEGGSVKPFAFEHLVEKEDVKASNLLLRKPWVLLQGDSSVESIIEKHRSDPAASYDKYITSLEDCQEYVPTLEQVFDELGNSIQYNIELKGLNPELGPRVLQIIERYQNLKVIISSFIWIPPALSKYSPNYCNAWEHHPNGQMDVDLLRPLVGNKLGIPIGLLFNNIESTLPSIERIVECARSFNAEWINVAHNFWKCQKPIVGSSIIGAEALTHLIEEMHKNNLKVLAYFLESKLDTEDDFKQQVKADVDALCPNDVETALKVCKLNQGLRTH